MAESSTGVAVTVGGLVGSQAEGPGAAGASEAEAQTSHGVDEAKVTVEQQSKAVPGPNHPWRTISPKLREQLKKQATVTESLNS